MKAAVDCTGKCPYCEYTWSVGAQDMRGELLALRCIDCKQIFVVEIAITCTAEVFRIAGVSSDRVLDDLGASAKTEPANEEPEKQHASPPPLAGLDRVVEDKARSRDTISRRHRIGYDDQVRIRQRYRKHMSGGTATRKSFFDREAAQFNVSPATIRNICLGSS